MGVCCSTPESPYDKTGAKTCLPDRLSQANRLIYPINITIHGLLDRVLIALS